MADEDEHLEALQTVRFSEAREGRVLVSRRALAKRQGAPGLDFYLVVSVNPATRSCLVRDVDGGERWVPVWAFDAVIGQAEAEALGACWRVAPQERPGLVGPPRHPPKLLPK